MSLLPHSNIRVDNFEFMKNDLNHYVFFLTHCHEGNKHTSIVAFSLINLIFVKYMLNKILNRSFERSNPKLELWYDLRFPHLKKTYLRSLPQPQGPSCKLSFI